MDEDDLLLSVPNPITMTHISTTANAGINVVNVPVQAGDLMVVHGAIWDTRTDDYFFTSTFSSNNGFTDPASGASVDNDLSGSDYRSIASNVAYKIIPDGVTQQTVAFYGSYGGADNETVIAQVFRPSRPIKDMRIAVQANSSVTGNANTSLDFTVVSKGDCLVWCGCVFGTSTSLNHFFDHDEVDAYANKTIHDVGGWDNRSAYAISNGLVDPVDTSAKSNPSVVTGEEAATNIAFWVR